MTEEEGCSCLNATTSPPPSHLVLMSGLIVRGEISDGIAMVIGRVSRVVGPVLPLSAIGSDP